jgi:hypothetical protein
MKTSRNDNGALVIKRRRIVLSGAALTLALSVYFISWHWSILESGSIFSVGDVAEDFMRLSAVYLGVSALASSIICGLLIAVQRPAARKFIAGAALFIFFASQFVRMFDWGALYFGGNHVDTNFWAHAFYAEGTVYLLNWIALGIYVSVILVFSAMFFIIRSLYRATGPAETGGRA